MERTAAVFNSPEQATSKTMTTRILGSSISHRGVFYILFPLEESIGCLIDGVKLFMMPFDVT